MKKKIEFEQHMTSIEIAELTNQNHKDLMKEIKKLEPEWVKLHGNGFILETFKDEQGKTQTCYSLTKPQTLFIARKLAGDAFSTFIIRWIQLNKELEDFVIPNLGSDDEILEKADNIIAEELEELNRDSKYCYTSTEIAKMYNGKMQGNDTESTVLQALERLQQDSEIDVICIVRGGGAKTDLNYFDSEALCRAVANCPVPVLTGIGHEIDKSLLDEVAYLSCITPTDCAKRLVERVQDSWQAMMSLMEDIGGGAKELLASSRETLASAGHSLQRNVTARIQKEKSDIAVKGTSLSKEVRFILKSEFQRAERNTEGLHQGSRKILELEKAKFQMAEMRVKNASPETVLKKGYSFTLDKNGKFIKSKSQVHPGDLITTRLADGSVESVVQ